MSLVEECHQGSAVSLKLKEDRFIHGFRNQMSEDRIQKIRTVPYFLDSLLSVDVTAMANVDDEHNKLLLANEVHDAIASDPVGIPAL